MVLLVTTPRILSALDAVPPSSRSPHPSISHLRTSDGSSNSRAWALNSLLHGMKVYRPPPPPKPEP
ncbi:hypothetical protein PHISP_05820, partial [Aspergillus sp. HF37]